MLSEMKQMHCKVLASSVRPLRVRRSHGIISENYSDLKPHVVLSVTKLRDYEPGKDQLIAY